MAIVLPNAPLVYTLGLIKFPTATNISDVAIKFRDAIGATHPIFLERKLQIISAKYEEDGFRVSNSDAYSYQFTSPDRKWAFVLNDDTLCLHTNSYLNHKDFITKYIVGLVALMGIPEFSAASRWILAVAVRYVDLIVPRHEEWIKDYLEPWVVPVRQPPAADLSGLNFIESMYVVNMANDDGLVRLQALICPPSTIPAELDTPLIRENDWVPSTPKGDFVVLDIDHATRLDTAVAMDTEFVTGSLHKLRRTVKDVFLRATTESARNDVWGAEAE